MNSLIIFSGINDEHVVRVIKHLPEHLIVYHFTFENIISQGYQITLDDNNDFVIKIGITVFKEKQIPDFTIWLRKPNLSFYYSLSNQQHENEYLNDECKAFFKTVCLIFSKAQWLNSYENISYAKGRLHQLQAASRLGMTVPNTLLTNVVNDIETSFHTKPKFIMKRLGNNKINFPEGVSIFASLFSLTDTDQFLFQRGINYLQEYIDAAIEIRATIVGDKVFACSFEKDFSNPTIIDYRNQLNVKNYKSVELPDELSNALRLLTTNYRLHYNTADLLQDKDGNYYFLEMNANGEYIWIEDLTGFAISKSIASKIIELCVTKNSC